jgi:hypothetical protein
MRNFTAWQKNKCKNVFDYAFSVAKLKRKIILTQKGVMPMGNFLQILPNFHVEHYWIRLFYFLHLFGSR